MSVGEQKEYDERIERIQKVAEKRGGLTRVFLEIQRLVPQDIWLENIAMTSKSMTIKGRALNDEKISTYLQNLSMSPFFEINAVVATDVSVAAGTTGSGQSQMDFTIEILQFNDPTEQEVKFVEEFRKETQDQDISVLLVRFDRAGIYGS